LAGLFEGDGHIILYKRENPETDYKEDKKVIGIIGITFNIKDLPLCKHLRTIIGHGWIRIKNKENACVLIFHTDEDIIKFVKLINGYIRGPKLYKFNIVIDYLNNKYSLNILKYKVNISDINSNSWFAGFVDADGGFNVRYTEGKKLRIVCEIRIEQRMIDSFSDLSYESLFLKLAEFLGQKLSISKHSTGKEYYLVRGSSQKNLIHILSYFN
jgi:hypothetical protein